MSSPRGARIAITAERSCASLMISGSFAVVVGILFGYYPAHKEAALDPIVELKFE